MASSISLSAGVHNSQPTALQMPEEAAQVGQASTLGATWGRIK
ncbi:MAG: hypothetical protein Q6J44_04820 [Gloeomargarita sp. DG02_4_bins_56]